jgi:hypothetical protein
MSDSAATTTTATTTTTSSTTSTAATACIMRPPEVRSLRWLQTQFELDGHLYPRSDALRRVVDTLVARMPNDDSCAPLGAFSMRRVFYDGKKLTLVPLLYRLCTPTQPDIPTARMRRLCACPSECANPRHWLPMLLFKQRERELQRNQYGNTRLTEAILAAHHPAAPRRRAAVPKRFIYKRLHVYVRMDDRSYAHIAPVKANSKLVGVYTLSEPLLPTNDVSVCGSTDNIGHQRSEEASTQRSGPAACATCARDDEADRPAPRGSATPAERRDGWCDTPDLHRDAAAYETDLPACAQRSCGGGDQDAASDEIRLVSAR